MVRSFSSLNEMFEAKSDLQIKQTEQYFSVAQSLSLFLLD